MWGFPGSSAGKESTCNARDPSLIPGLGRSLGEGIGYPLQYSWASLVSQTVKNPCAMQETWVQSLGWDDPLEEDITNHASIPAWRIPMDRGAWQAAVHGSLRVGYDFTFTFHFHALEKEMVTHSSVLAWRIPGTGEPGGLPSMGLHRVGHDWSDLAAAVDSFLWLYFLVDYPSCKIVQDCELHEVRDWVCLWLLVRLVCLYV